MKQVLLIMLVFLSVVILYALTVNREGLEVVTKIADEGGYAKVLPNTKVKYGADTRWTWKIMGSGNGSFKCDNNTFGDPAYGTRKVCYKVETKPDPAPPAPVLPKVAAPPPIVLPKVVTPPPASLIKASSPPSAISEVIASAMGNPPPTKGYVVPPPTPFPAPVAGNTRTAQSCDL